MSKLEQGFIPEIKKSDPDEPNSGDSSKKRPERPEKKGNRFKQAVVGGAVAAAASFTPDVADATGDKGPAQEGSRMEQAGVMESQEGISRKGHVYEFPPVQTRVIKGQGERDGEEPKRIKDYIAGESGFPGERPRGALGRLIEGHQDSGLKEIKPEGPSPDLSEIKPAKPKKGKSKE